VDGTGRVDGGDYRALMQIFEHHSSLGQWRVAQRRADPRLRDYVHGYVVSEGYLPTAVREWHVPSLEVAVVLNFASPHRMLDASDPKNATAYRGGFVVGLQSRHRLTEAVGARDFIVIRFTPIGAHLFLKTPMNLLADRTIELEEIDGRLAQRFENRVRATPGWEARLNLIERLIAERLTQAPSPPSVLMHAWQRLINASDSIDLALLSAESGCSRRHLIARFHSHFGMAPKTIARISRFNLALGRINRVGEPYLDLERDSKGASNVDIPWAELALGCGYYDQSHFIKEFRAFAGVTPVEFMRRMRSE